MALAKEKRKSACWRSWNTGGLETAAFVIAVVALALFLLAEIARRPRLDIEAGEWSDPGVPWQFAAVRVSNRSLTPLLAWLFTRNVATGCHVSLTYRKTPDSEPAIDGLAGRWSAHPEPLRIDTDPATSRVSVRYEVTLVPASYRHDIGPTGVGEEMAVAVRRDGETYAFSAESYRCPAWRRPEWKLPEPAYLITVRARAAGARAEQTFRLDTATMDLTRQPVASKSAPIAAWRERRRALRKQHLKQW